MFPKVKGFFNNSKEVSLLAGTLVICLIFLEIGLRAHYVLTYPGSIEDAYQYPQNPQRGSHVTLGSMTRPSPNRRIIYELKPNLDVYHMGVQVTTNSLGWREKEILKEKNKSTIRIIGIGDSTMYGWGVNEDERYMDVLENKLNKSFPEYNWEILVFAVPGYNLVMEVEVLKQYALGYDPDLVVYGFTDNDHCLPNFISPERNFFSKRVMIIDYLKQSIGRSIFLKGSNLLEKPIWENCRVEDVSETYKDFVGMDSFMKALKELGDVGSSKGSPIIFFSEEEIDPTYKIVHENIHYFNAEGEKQHYLSSHQDKWLDLVISKRDQHPSLIGHEVMADAIYSQLVEGKFIEGLMVEGLTISSNDKVK